MRLFAVIIIALAFVFGGVVTEYVVLRGLGQFSNGRLFSELSLLEHLSLWWDAGIKSLRYILIPILALAIPLLVGAHYVQDIYELDSYWVGLRYLIACMFALGYPRLEIAEGKKQISLFETNTMAQIGGPGYIMVRPGNVVLCERLKRPSEVLAAGWHFVTRHEFIKDIADLNDQHGLIEKSGPVLSKDGILVSVHDIHFLYRLWGSRREGGQTGRTPENPYPYSIQAVRNMIYNRVKQSSGLGEWHAAVQSVVEGTIGDYIRGNQVDAVTAPPSSGTDPRLAIRKNLMGPGARNRLKDIGAELVWFDIGYFSVEEEVEDQRINTWSADWIGNAKMAHAYGEAQRQVFEELGRAEAQAEIIMSVVNALGDLGIPADRKSEANLTILLMRTGQVLETLSKVYDSKYSDEPKLLNDSND